MKKFVAYITILSVILSLASCAMRNGGNETDGNRNYNNDTIGTNEQYESSDIKIFAFLNSRFLKLLSKPAEELSPV